MNGITELFCYITENSQSMFVKISGASLQGGWGAQVFSQLNPHLWIFFLYPTRLFNCLCAVTCAWCHFTTYNSRSSFAYFRCKLDRQIIMRNVKYGSN